MLSSYIECMPTVHLTKVAFACRDVDSLQQRIAKRAADGELKVATRMRPKRASELVGGNLYWIVKHRIVAGNTILRFEDRADGRIDIVCSAELVAVSPMPRRAHQGWRYLEDKDAPSAEDDGTGLGLLPPRLYGRLAALALV
jgi:hypothetical protein